MIIKGENKKRLRNILGQKAYMSGKLKIKGQMMLATKLDTVFKELAGDKSKL